MTTEIHLPTGSAPQPTPPSTQTSGFSDWVKWGIETGLDFYKSKNAPRPVASSSAPGIWGFQAPSSQWTQTPGLPNQAALSGSSSAFPTTLILAIAGIGLVVLLVMLRR